MLVNRVSYGMVSPNFKAVSNPSSDSKKEGSNAKKSGEDRSQKYKVSGLVLASALSAATLAGAIVHGKMNKKLMKTNEVLSDVIRQTEDLSRECFRLKGEVNNKSITINKLNKDNEELAKSNKTLDDANKQLEKQARELRAKLDSAFKEPGVPDNLLDDIYKAAEVKVNSGKLEYDIMEPPIVGKGGKVEHSDAVDLVTTNARANRAHVKPLNIPEIAPDGSFDYKVPYSPEVKITKMESKEFSTVHGKETNVTESYADSVNWNNDKIARDVLQNFFDGHGQTLDGVRLKFSPNGKGGYKIRIEGNSTYTPDKAIYIGESTKRNNSKAAGNYGEGLKMSVLKLLRDKGAKEVKVGSDNWDLTYRLAPSQITDKRVMAYDLERTAQKLDGNYVEFETDDRTLLDTLRKSINRFYHSGNEHFKSPDFENNLIGIKLLKQGTSYLDISIPGEKGGLYIAGQRFEVNGDFEGLEGANVFIKQKPPIDVLDPSRDRTSLNDTDLMRIGMWLAKTLSFEDKVKFVSILEPLWKYKKSYEETCIDKMFKGFTYLQGTKNDGRLGEYQLFLKFPKDKYVAYSNATPELVQDLQAKGYVVCGEDMSKLGMQTIRELMGDVRAHEPIAPTSTEIRKINILKEALRKITSIEKHFSKDELDAKIYLFDRNSAKESRTHGHVNAEAITDKGTSKGFWIDKSYLNENDFGDILETALHELCHKIGGDESQEFSYLLTDVNANVIKDMVDNPKVKLELRALNRLWNETL